jgi:hypothetical protein
LIVELQIVIFSIDEVPYSPADPVPIPEPSSELPFTCELEIEIIPIEQQPPSDAYPVPIAELPSGPLASIAEFQIVMFSINEIPSSPYAYPVPIPEPPYETPFTCEVEMKRSPIDELPPLTSPVPTPAPWYTLTSTCELETKRIPIEELPADTPGPAPIPGLYMRRHEQLATTVEFQITILSTLEVPREPEPPEVPIDDPI